MRCQRRIPVTCNTRVTVKTIYKLVIVCTCLTSLTDLELPMRGGPDDTKDHIYEIIDLETVNWSLRNMSTWLFIQNEWLQNTQNLNN